MSLNRILFLLLSAALSSCGTTSGGGGLGPTAGSACSQAQNAADTHLCGGPTTVLKCKSSTAPAAAATGFDWEASECSSGKVCQTNDCAVPSAAGPDTTSSSGNSASANGIWNGSCSGQQPSGTFEVEVDSSGMVTGKLKGDSTGTIAGVLSASGSLNAQATGTAGNCPWTGTLTKVGNSLTGSGQWSCPPCSGMWQTK